MGGTRRGRDGGMMMVMMMRRREELGGPDCDDTNASAALSALYYKCICMTTKYTYKHHNRTLVHNVHSALSKMF